MLTLRGALVIAVGLCACKPVDDTERPTVKFLVVEARPQPAHVRGVSLVVRIELEVTSRMPHVAPHVNVLARCDDLHDRGQAFFMDLSNARPGDRKIDTAELFRVASLEGRPSQCELTLSLSEGATPPEHFCFTEGLATRPGKC